MNNSLLGSFEYKGRDYTVSLTGTNTAVDINEYEYSILIENVDSPISTCIKKYIFCEKKTPSEVGLYIIRDLKISTWKDCQFSDDPEWVSLVGGVIKTFEDQIVW